MIPALQRRAALCYTYGGLTRKAFGKGAVDGLTERLVKRMSTTGGKLAMKFISSAAGDGFEEFLASVLGPVAERIYNDKSLSDAYGSMTAAGYEALIGAIPGRLGFGANISGEVQGVGNITSAGVETPQTETGAPAQAQKTALPDGAKDDTVNSTRITRALEMRADGKTGGEIFAETGLVSMNGMFADGFDGPVVWRDDRGNVGSGADDPAGFEGQQQSQAGNRSNDGHAANGVVQKDVLRAEWDGI